MKTGFKQDIASRFGIKPAIILEFFIDQLAMDREKERAYIKDGKQWHRCSIRMITARLPFLTEHMVSRAVKVLIKKKVLVKADLNENRFDHTLWYAFTEYGRYLMGEACERDDGNG